MRAARSLLRVLCLLLVPSEALLAADSPSFERAGQWVSRDRFEKAVADLQGLSSVQPSSAEEKILRRAVGKARAFLSEKHPLQERNAARQVLCLSRAYFQEELPGDAEPLRSMGGPQRPELIGKPAALQVPAAARKAGIQGTVIVEVVVDQEGCVRRPRILKGLPLGIDGAALAAVRSWTFRPGMLAGRPVAVYYVVTVSTPPRR
ncbi:MAG TPA: energy transducer TonB [Thermoanaerobaculia bacterium]|nr:energy transducer TonB [Thermoanaerobaculia bacterium]